MVLQGDRPIDIGQVEAIFRYPVKSMGGQRLEDAELGWHGLEGGRRLAFRRLDDRSGFPWLTASRLPELLLFAPHHRTVVRANQNNAGIYGTVTRTGRLAIGQTIRLRRA